MVKASNLVQMRLISFRLIIELGTYLFETFIFFTEFQYAHLAQTLLTIDKKTAENIFFQSCLFEKHILQLKRAREADSNCYMYHVDWKNP